MSQNAHTALPPPRPWPLDYGWGHKHWSENTDVLLQGHICAAQPVLPAVEQWLSSKHTGEQWLDGRKATVYYEGGASFYAHARAPHRREIAAFGYAASAAHACTIFLHSRGQDAFDSIHWYTGEIADALAALPFPVMLRWHKARHMRRWGHLDWRAPS